MHSIAESSRAEFEDTWRRLGWAVVSVKLRAARNRFAVTRRKSPLRTMLQFAVVLPSILLLTGILAVGFASAVSNIDDQGLATTLLAVVLAIFAIGSFVGSSTTALQALYLSDDVPFLMTLPIPLRALFGGKFAEASVGALPPATLFVAGMIGYGWDRSEHVLYWVVGLFVGLSIAILATAISVIVVSTVTRFIPPRRARLFLFLISLLLISVTMIAWRALAPRPEAFKEAINRDEYSPLWHSIAWTPVGWGAEAMTAAASGEVTRAIVLVGAVIAASAAGVAISFNLFRRTFIRGLAQTRAVQANSPNASLTRWLGYCAEPLPVSLGAAVLKEWLVLIRDLRRLAGAIWPVGIVIVYTILLGRGNGSDFGSRDLVFWSRNGSLALLPWGLSLGISVYSYGSEGRNVHLLRMLPFSAVKVFSIKVLASLLPVAAVSVGAAILSLWFRGAPLLPSMQLLALMAWMVTGFVVIDTAAAAMAPNFDTDQVQRTISMAGRLFSFVAGGVFAVATILAAGRLIMMKAQPPASVKDLLSIDAGGFEPFGWPLVIVAGLAALGIVSLSAAFAIRQTDRLIDSGI